MPCGSPPGRARNDRYVSMTAATRSGACSRPRASSWWRGPNERARRAYRDHRPALLGEPNLHLSSKVTAALWLHGSLAVEISGKKAGTWYCHETSTGGGLLALIVRERGGTRRAAIDWIKSLGIDLASGNGAAGPPRRRVAEYVYHDRIGEPLSRVVRWGPERTFTQERYEPATGKFVGGKRCMAGVQRVPYRLHEWADEPGRVFVVEGEKDADRLASLGEHATTNAGGAGKWPKDFAGYFAGREVIICGDNDQAGKKHVRQVAANLAPVARSLRIVWVPPRRRRRCGRLARRRAHARRVLLSIPSRNRATAQPSPEPEPVKPPKLAESLDILAEFRGASAVAWAGGRERNGATSLSRHHESAAGQAGLGRAQGPFLERQELTRWIACSSSFPTKR